MSRGSENHWFIEFLLVGMILIFFIITTVVTIIVGTQLDRSMLLPEAGAVVYTHTAVLVLFEVVHHCLMCRQDCQDKGQIILASS